MFFLLLFEVLLPPHIYECVQRKQFNCGDQLIKLTHPYRRKKKQQKLATSSERERETNKIFFYQKFMTDLSDGTKRKKKYQQNFQ